MATESNLRALLPEAPEPRGEARDQAIAAALTRFDENFSSSRKGTAREERLMERTANPTRPSHRRSAMSQARYAIAASLVFLIAGSVAWFYVNEAPLRWKAGDGAAPEIAVTEQQSPTAVRKVPTTGIAGAPERKRAPWPASPTSPKAEFRLYSSANPEPTARVASTDLERSLEQLQASRGPKLSPYADELAYAPAPSEPAPQAEPVGRDQFEGARENAFKLVREAPVSTFSIDVDTASYSFMRASLNHNVLPQPAAVRTEELINYFPYDYAAPASADEPFQTSVAVFPSPWSEGRKLIRIGIKGYEIEPASPAARQPRVPDRHVGFDGRARTGCPW